MSAPSIRPPRPMGFTGGTLLRAAENRTEETLATALAHPAARFYLSRGGQWLSRGTTDRPGPAFDLTEATALGGEPGEAVLLGWTPGDLAPRLALALPPSEEPIDGIEPLDLRTAGMGRLLDPDIEAHLAQGQHFLNWHRRSRFCGACGAPTRSVIGGYRRDCTACGDVQFPRTDPVVIMLIHDGEGGCVFGRQRHFKPGMWSCLAGFLEPGETIEDAVRREVAEEVGLVVGRVDYRFSQPWPFPGSLMIGCIGQAEHGPLTIQESELEDGRWFSREEVAAMLADTHPDGLSMPPDYAIAHHLARAFCES